jgi:hypothetical protein
MAAASKPTGVHVSLIIFVMSSIIFGLMWYMEMDKRTTVEAEAKKARDDVNTLKNDKTNLEADLTEVLKKYGSELPIDNIGRDGAEGETTVLNNMTDDVKLYAGDGFANQTVRAALKDMRTRIDALTKDKNTATANLNDAQAKILSLSKEFQVQVDKFSQSADAEAAHAQKAEADKDEAIRTRQESIDNLQKQLSQERVEHETERDRQAKEIELLKKDNSSLIAANNKLQDEIQDIKEYSFDVPDGEIRAVDHANKLVWINLGELDRLPVKTTFSVYTKAHQGVARGNEDVKGSVEITRVLGPHLAEARILKSDDSRPIAEGDPVYTPLWSAGKIEYFAIVGKVDFDSDGRDDRARLHDLIAAANAKIESEVDDNGNLNGPGVTVRTRFLVVGDIPSPLINELTAEEIEAANKMNKLHEDLVNEARKQGVRVVNMNDFLNYIGYTSTRRIWTPGENRAYPLKSNAPPLGIDPTVNDRYHATKGRGKFTGRGAKLLQEKVKGKDKKSTPSKADEEK